MPLTHFLLALSVVLVWGTNFVVIRWGLDGLPPFLFAALRFAFSALPWLLFVPPPAVRWWRLATFGVLLGVGQFGLMFLAMRSNISPGMASLVIQMQVFFTIVLSIWWLRERVRPYQLAGLALALAGLGVIAGHLDASVTLLGLGTVLAAAFCWACANLVAKSAGPVNMLHFMVWSSAFAVPPLVGLSLWLEGPQAMADALRHAGLMRMNFGVFVLHAVQLAMWVAVPALLVQAGLPKAEHWQVYLPAVLGSFVLMGGLFALERRGHLKKVFLAAILLIVLVQLGLLVVSSGTPTLWPLGGLLFVFFCGFNVLEATQPSLVSRLAPAHVRGTAMGVYNTLQSLGFFVGGWAGGALLKSWGSQMLFLCCAAAMLLWWLVALPMQAPGRQPAAMAA